MAFIKSVLGGGKRASGEDPPQTLHHAALEKPLESPDQDQLGRVRLAHNVYRLLVEQSLDQSVRVAVLGEWGSGKTTVAKWIANLAKHDGHVVVWISPWAAGSLSDLWIQFTQKLFEALQTANLPTSYKDKAKQYGAIAAKYTEKLSQANKITAAGREFGTQFLKLSDDDIARIQRDLGGRKVIIVIDDLDRTDPELLPKTFLSLRELLDKPGFCFVIPFAYDIVSAALAEHHKAWGTGEGFLEKVLDYRFVLPPTSPEQRWSMFAADLVSTFKYFPELELRPLADALPDNPRRIKAVARALLALRPEIERHRADELDWRSMVLAALIRFESTKFYERYILQTVKAEHSDIARAAAQLLNRNRKEAEERLERDINENIDACGIADERTKDRLINLSKQWHELVDAQTSARVRYSLRFFDEPEGFTWADVDELTSTWSSEGKLEKVLALIEQGAKRTGSLPRAYDEILTSISMDYARLLENAASSLTSGELGDFHAVAASRLTLLEALLQTRTATQENRLRIFEWLVDTHVYWTNFRTNPADTQARDREFLLISKLISLVGSDWYKYIIKIEQIDATVFDERREAKQALSVLLDTFTARAAQHVLEEMYRQGGVHRIFEQASPLMIKRLLLDVNSFLWRQRAAEVQELFSNASVDRTVHRNCYAFVEYVAEGDIWTRGLLQKDIDAFVAHPRAVGAAWAAAVAQQIQHRMISAAWELRQKLQAKGASDSALVCPPWLHVGQKSLGDEHVP